MDVQNITLLIGIIALACFFGTMLGVQLLVKRGKDPGKQLQVADAMVDAVVEVNTAVKPFIPTPIESIIDTVLKVTQAGVHSAQQLYNSGQLPPDLRKEQATQYAVDMIKLTGREVTPELEQTIRNTAEAAVYVMKQKDPVPMVVPDPAQILAPTDSVSTPKPSSDVTMSQSDTTPTQPLVTPVTDELQLA